MLFQHAQNAPLAADRAVDIFADIKGGNIHFASGQVDVQEREVSLPGGRPTNGGSLWPPKMGSATAPTPGRFKTWHVANLS
jgi:hypothetical protein